MAIPTKEENAILRGLHPSGLWPGLDKFAEDYTAAIAADLSGRACMNNPNPKPKPPAKIHPRMPEQRNVFIRGLLLGMSAGVSELTDVLSSDDASTASSRVCAVFKTPAGREVSVLVSFPFGGAVLEPGFFEELRARIRMETSE